MCHRDLVNPDQCFPLRSGLALIVAGLELRDRHAEALRQRPRRILESDLVLQLDELEDVAADAAAEAVEEPLVAVDGERRRLLAVKRAESLVRIPSLAQRYRVGDDRHDVRGRTDFVNEGLGKKRHSLFAIRSSRPAVRSRYYSFGRTDLGAPYMLAR